MTIHYSFAQTLRSIFTDGGALLFCIVVPLLYPVLYSLIYNGENVREVPVTVVDDCHSPMSRDYIRRLDATPDVRVAAHAPDILAAQQTVREREAYGIVRIPADFQTALMQGRQTHVQAYCDMGGMLYYKAILTANTDVSLTMNAEVKVADLGGNPIALASGIHGGTAEQRGVLQHPVRYEPVALYNAQNGFASFLIPAVLVLVIQQTMLLGIGLIAGTRRERGLKIDGHMGTFAVLTGTALAFITVYIPVSAYVLCVVPAIFHLPQTGSLWQLAMLMLPFLVAVFNWASRRPPLHASAKRYSSSLYSPPFHCFSSQESAGRERHSPPSGTGLPCSSPPPMAPMPTSASMPWGPPLPTSGTNT